jgi:tetratricopeptide (TPR) repeat protein
VVVKKALLTAVLFLIGAVVGASASRLFGQLSMQASSEAHYQEGKAAQKRGAHLEAIRAFAVAIALAPDSWMPHVAIGDTYEAMGDYRSAVQEYEFAVQLISETEGASASRVFRQKIEATRRKIDPPRENERR